MLTKFWSKGLNVRDHREDYGIEGRILLKIYIKVIMREVFNYVHVS